MEHDNNTVRHMPAPAARRAAAPDRLRQLTQENELAYSRLEQERAARVQAEKDLAGVKALLRETNQQLAKQRRTLTWQFGEAVTRARTLKDYVLLPYRLIKLSEDHRRQSRHAPVVRKHASAALPAETASAIKEALEYVKRVRSPEVILWIGRQPWPAEVRAKVFCEVAKWARTSYPQIAEQIVQQLLGLDPAAPHVRQLAFSLYDAGIVDASAQLLRAARTAGATFSTAERLRAERIEHAQGILAQSIESAARGDYTFDFDAQGPIVILSPVSILQGRNAASNALHRFALSMQARYGDTMVISLAAQHAESADAAPGQQADAALHARTGLVVDGVAYRHAPAISRQTPSFQDVCAAMAETVLAATVRQQPRAVLAWDDAYCALGASAAAQTLRVPYGLVLQSLDFFQKTAANHLLSERARVDLNLLTLAARQADLLALGSPALQGALENLLDGSRPVALVPPLPLPPMNHRKEAPPDLAATLRRLEGKRVFAVTEDEPAVATARALIDLYAEISFVQPDAVLLVMSNGKAAAAMRHHAVAIGLQEGQVVFAPPASDAISREQLLRRVEIALFPYVDNRAEVSLVPSAAALLECMALGVCPAVGPAPAYAAHVEAGRNGVPIDLNAPAAETAAHLQQVLGEAGELGKRARESVQRDLPWHDYDEAIGALLLQAATPQPHILGRRAEPQLLHLKVS